ncbi:MAG: polymorphic toxin-type HINT domain-containing protein [Planctomycetaceae bacterium]
MVRGEALSQRPITEELGDDNLPSLAKGRWVEARYLEVGDLLLTPHGELRVDDLFREETTAQVFNLQIAECHTYAVGNAAILVHNASPAACCSGMSYTGDKSPNFTVKAGNRVVTVYGEGQKTGDADCSNGVNKHRQTSINIATKAAKSGQYEYCTMDRAWSTSTGGVSSCNKRPDVICVKCNGQVDAWEVQSRTDEYEDLEERLQAGMKTLPAPVQGEIDVLEMEC